MKKLKLVIFTIFCALMLPNNILAEEIEYIMFDSNVIINKDRTVDVTENFSLYFFENTKNVNRNLQTDVTLVRPDKSKILINAKVNNAQSKTIKVGSKKEKGKISLELPVNGKQSDIENYDLSYKYNLGKDTSSKEDEIYFDIIDNLDAAISNLTFTVKLPDKVNINNVKFAIDGDYNLTENDLVINYEDNIIIGSLNKILEKGQTFSIYATFENGFFVGATDNFNYFNYLILMLPIIIFVISILMWKKYGYKNKISIYNYAEFKNNFDPVEIGYLYKGKTIEIDMVSILIYLANEGYLKIEENDDGYKLGKENTFRFIKVKDYDKNNAIQKMVFEHLFYESDTVELESLEFRFADKFNEAKAMLDNKDNYDKMFFSNVDGKKVLVFVGIIISVFMIGFNPIHIFTGGYVLIFIMSLLFCLGLYIIFSSNLKPLAKIVLGILFMGGYVYMSVSALLEQPKMLIIYCVGLLLIFLSMILCGKLSSRTRFGNKKLSDAYSMKIYLQTMKKEELKDILIENPNFFYDMVPYAYTLDIFSEWLDKGRGIIMTNPSWRITSQDFEIENFKKFVDNVLYNTTRTMLRRNYAGYDNIKYYDTNTKTKLND